MTKYTRSSIASDRVASGRPTLDSLRHLSLVQWNAILMGVLALLVVAFLVVVNRTTARTFDRRAAEDRITAIRADMQDLELKVHELRSLSRIQEAAQSQNMVTVGRVEYLAPTGSVAVKP